MTLTFSDTSQTENIL